MLDHNSAHCSKEVGNDILYTALLIGLTEFRHSYP